jgi:hypothetical protein
VNEKRFLESVAGAVLVAVLVDGKIDREFAGGKLNGGKEVVLLLFIVSFPEAVLPNEKGTEALDALPVLDCEGNTTAALDSSFLLHAKSGSFSSLQYFSTKFEAYLT